MKEEIKCLSQSSPQKNRFELMVEVKKIQLNFKIYREKSSGSYKFGKKLSKPKPG